MKNSELKALISLLDDDDKEVLAHVEGKIMALGSDIIPMLESEWENNFNPVVQQRIEELIHTVQFELLKDKLITWKERSEQDLLEGLWLVATYQYPDLELSTLRKDLEQIYYETWLEFKNEVHPYDQVKILNSVLFNKLRFAANTKNFHSPGNSMLNIVLETKRGNPISLCAVYMLVAQKLKLPVYGVNLPNLFILTYKSDDIQFYINAFNRGLIFSKTDIDNYIAHLNLPPKAIFYEPASNINIVRRAMRNLLVAFDKLGEQHKKHEIEVLLSALESGEDNEAPDNLN